MNKILDKEIEKSWFSLSLPAQMVNIGNEVKRAFRFSDIDKQNRFLDKAIGYIILSSKDKKNAKVANEILIGVDVLNDIKSNSESYYKKQQILNYYRNFTYYLSHESH